MNFSFGAVLGLNPGSMLRNFSWWCQGTFFAGKQSWSKCPPCCTISRAMILCFIPCSLILLRFSLLYCQGGIWFFLFPTLSTRCHVCMWVSISPYEWTMLAYTEFLFYFFGMELGPTWNYSRATPGSAQRSLLMILKRPYTVLKIKMRWGASKAWALTSVLSLHPWMLVWWCCILGLFFLLSCHSIHMSFYSHVIHPGYR